jgi:hypothetical protein
MKALISIFAVALALAFTVPAFAGDVTAAKTRGRLQEGWRHVGCCDQYVLREKDVSASFVVDRKASASADAFFLIIVPSNWNPDW